MVCAEPDLTATLKTVTQVVITSDDKVCYTCTLCAIVSRLSTHRVQCSSAVEGKRSPEAGI